MVSTKYDTAYPANTEILERKYTYLWSDHARSNPLLTFLDLKLENSGRIKCPFFHLSNKKKGVSDYACYD